MFPIIISKSKLQQIKRDKKEFHLKPKRKEEPKRDAQIKNIVITRENLASIKSKRVKRKLLALPSIIAPSCDCSLMHVTRIVVSYAPKSRKRDGSNIVLSMTWGTGQKKRMRLPSVKPVAKKKKKKSTNECCNSEDFFMKLEVFYSSFFFILDKLLYVINNLKLFNLSHVFTNYFSKGSSRIEPRTSGLYAMCVDL